MMQLHRRQLEKGLEKTAVDWQQMRIEGKATNGKLIKETI